MATRAVVLHHGGSVKSHLRKVVIYNRVPSEGSHYFLFNTKVPVETILI